MTSSCPSVTDEQDVVVLGGEPAAASWYSLVTSGHVASIAFSDRPAACPYTGSDAVGIEDDQVEALGHLLVLLDDRALGTRRKVCHHVLVAHQDLACGHQIGAP